MEEWDYAFDSDKNAWLIRERGISFEQIIALIESGNLFRYWNIMIVHATPPAAPRN